MRYVILGASSGIGAALTASLAADGHALFTGARRVALLRREPAAHPRTITAYCDVTNRESVARFWEFIGWAGGQIDGLVVTVGAQGEINRVADSDPDAWWGTVATNLYGPYLTLRYALPHLKPDARVILCAGGGSHTPWPHYSAYACAKAGLVRLVETLAQEIAQPVNALAPGFVPTPIHQATLAAGRERAGPTYDKVAAEWPYWDSGSTHEVMTLTVACARWLLLEAPAALTGRTISAQHDPWRTEPERLLVPGVGTSMRLRPTDVEPIPVGARRPAREWVTI